MMTDKPDPLDRIELLRPVALALLPEKRILYSGVLDQLEQAIRALVEERDRLRETLRRVRRTTGNKPTHSRSHATEEWQAGFDTGAALMAAAVERALAGAEQAVKEACFQGQDPANANLLFHVRVRGLPAMAMTPKEVAYRMCRGWTLLARADWGPLFEVVVEEAVEANGAEQAAGETA